ncbi:MAG: UDP-N-acetylglucosamine 2-epimerase, partial [Calditrichia bacterium]
RLVTDSISDFLFVTEESGRRNLLNEGHSEEKIHFTGNVMIDSLKHFLPLAQNSPVLDELGLQENNFVLVTLHRPSNVDQRENFMPIYRALKTISRDLPVAFPVHPRTEKNLETFGLAQEVRNNKGFRMVPPLGYLDFIHLESKARFILTDSGGLQEETTWLSIPCLTVRENTERPVTVEAGTNEIMGRDTEKIEEAARRILQGEWKKGRIPEFWDGNAAERIVDVLRPQ